MTDMAKFPADVMVNWMGETVPMCAEHASEAQRVAMVLGFVPSITPLPDGPARECSNCKREKHDD